MLNRTRGYVLTAATLLILTLLPGARLDRASVGLAQDSDGIYAAVPPSTESVPALAPAVDAATQAQVEAALHSSPVMFIENVGQFAEGARFRVYGGDRDMWLADDGLWITVWEPAPAGDLGPDRRLEDLGLQESQPRRGVALHLSFVGANPHPELEPFAPLETGVSYFIGNDPSRWRSQVPVWGGVRYTNLYDGVDLEILGHGSGWVWRAIVRETHDPLQKVRLRVDGADALELSNGALLIDTELGEVTVPLLGLENSPVPTYLRPSATRNEVASPFSAQSINKPSSTQVESNNLAYGTFIGGTSDDEGRAVAVDGLGNAYVAGISSSSLFTTTPGAFDTSYNGGQDCFVVKLVTSGDGQDDLVYAAFVGGGGGDGANAMSVDSLGNIYLAGTTQSSDFPTTDGAFDADFNGSVDHPDGFLVLLNPAGNGQTDLLYATYLGGNQADIAKSIALGGSGEVYVTGITYSSDFPLTLGAFDSSHNASRSLDVFVTKLSPANNGLDDLVYSSYVGGEGSDQVYSMDVDAEGHVYLVGDTISSRSSDFPTTPGAFDTTYGGEGDGFLVKINPSGNGQDDLLYSTLVGGSEFDSARAVVVDPGGSVYVTGYTNSSDFPVTQVISSTAITSGGAFAIKLHPGGTGPSDLLYSTLVGGDGVEIGVGIAVDDAGCAYITGDTMSSDFPVTSQAFQSTRQGGQFDAFLTKFSADGSRLDYSTYLGGESIDHTGGLDLDASGNVYVAGWTYSANFPTTEGALDTVYGGHYKYDGFLSVLDVGDGATYSISGYVRDGSGNPIPDVTLSAGASHSATTDAGGYYALTGLPAGEYVLRPAKPAWVFAPEAITAQVQSDRTNQNFRGQATACAVPVSGPFLQFPLAGYRTPETFAVAARDTWDKPGRGLLDSWFDHDTPTYTPADGHIQLYRGEPYPTSTDPERMVWGNLYCGEKYCYDNHNGYDITRPSGSGDHPAIYAAAEGTVVAVCSGGSSTCKDTTCGALGKQVWVDHGNNYATLYAHLDTVSVVTGTHVTTDTLLGMMGCTGNVTGTDPTHLHFGVYFNWNLRDPWITSIGSADEDEVVDPFGWDGLEEDPSISDPWDTPSVDLWMHSPRRASVLDSAGGILGSPSGRVTADIPADALNDLTLMALREAPVSAPSAALRSTGNGFSLQALWDWITGGSALEAETEGSSLAKPITVTVSYADAPLAHLDAAQLALRWWDAASESWQPLNTTLDPVSLTATAQTTQLGAFDLQAPLVCSDDVLETNDGYATASLLLVQDSVHTLFDIPDDEDWFRFEAEAGVTYTLEISELVTGVDTFLELYDTDAATLLAQDDDGGEGVASRLVWAATASRSFYVRLRPAKMSLTGCDAYYTLSLSSSVPVSDYRVYLPVVLHNYGDR